MNIRYMPELEEAKALAASGDYQVIPVKRSILSDSRTPVEVLRILRSVSRHCFLLESAEASKTWGRYTFLGYDPKLEFTCTEGKITIKSGMTMTVESRDPAQYIRQILDENKAPRIPGMPPFTGGLMGYFSYDYIKYAEPSLNLDAKDPGNFKDVDLMLFDKVICFDNYRQTITVIVNVRTEELEENYRKAQLELDEMVNLIKHGTPKQNAPLKLKGDFEPLFNKEQFCEMVEKARHYIYEGDIFQVVLSNRLQADAEGSLFDTYRLLRATNPSPYMFYIVSDDVEIAGASPETLVKLENGVLHTFPLAGTRPRGATDEEDKALGWSCWPTRRNAASTICWWTLAATTSAA